MWDAMPSIKSELDVFEQALIGQFGSKHNVNANLDKLSLTMIQSGGKRLRPAMLIASAMMGEYDREKAIQAAVSIELLHTATLAHDDIIDNAKTRRNVPTVYASHGPHAAVFTGDYIFVKSILALSVTGLDAAVMQQLAKAVQAVCVGEVAEYWERGTIPSFKDYISRVFKKTGVLFAASCSLGAHTGKLSQDVVKLAARFGGYFGIAFQILDDLLDIEKDQQTAGKPVGNDLKEGIVTLPVLIAASADGKTQKTIERCLNSYQDNKSVKYLESFAASLAGSNAVRVTKMILNRYLFKAKKILEKLPDSQGKTALAAIMLSVFGQEPA